MPKYNIKVSNDYMVASITMQDDGKQPTKPDIIEIIKSNNIVFGILEDSIDNIVADPKYDVEIPIAYGVGPKKGDKGKFVMQITKKEHEINGDYIDLRERSNIVSIDKEQIIGEIIPPTKGQPGKNVKGEVIEGLEGEKANVGLGQNVSINENKKIISKESGELIFKKEGNNQYYIDVSKIKRIKGDLDYSTGNIRFPGTVIIEGNVKPGFVLEAEDDIEIKGVSEAATLIAGNNIKINGIKGGGKGIIKANNLYANFIENAHIEMSEDVFVKQSIINSIVKAGKNIIIKDTKGRIAGGTSEAGYKIESPYLGSQINVKTVAQVGIPPSLNEELTILEAQIKLDIENLKKLSIIIKGMIKYKKEGLLNEDKLEQYKKTLETAKQLKSALAKNEIKLNNLKSTIEKSKVGGMVAVREIVYPGTEIIIHRKKYFPNKEITKAIFSLSNDDRIILKGYTNDKDGAKN